LGVRRERVGTRFMVVEFEIDDHEVGVLFM